MYLQKTDIQKGIQPEILTVISRTDTNIDNAIAEAVAKVGSYLRSRYDMDAEFAKTGTARNILVVMLVRDIAIYNLYGGSNPVSMPEAQVLKYKDAISFLERVQSEKATIDGLARNTDETSGSSYLTFGSNTKRNNHY